MVTQFVGKGSVKAYLRRAIGLAGGRIPALAVLAAFFVVQAAPLWQDSPCAASPASHRCACGSEEHETSECCCRAETHASPLSHCSWKALPCGAEDPTALDSAFTAKPMFAEDSGVRVPDDAALARVSPFEPIATGADPSPPVPPPRLPIAA